MLTGFCASSSQTLVGVRNPLRHLLKMQILGPCLPHFKTLIQQELSFYMLPKDSNSGSTATFEKTPLSGPIHCKHLMLPQIKVFKYFQSRHKENKV